MKNICLHFSVHQPFRLRTYRFFDIGHDHYYYDDFSNKSNALTIAKRCYIPMNNLLLSLINANKKAFKVSFSITGVALEQFEMYTPEVIESFKKLAKTGCVEFVVETDDHSLASVNNQEEFAIQVKHNADKIASLFGQEPKILKNTGLIYSDNLGQQIYNLGYQGVMAEGADQILGWKSPNFVYCDDKQPRLKVLLRNYKLTDDLTLRFSSQNWSEYPLSAEKYVSWIVDSLQKEDVVNLFYDYRTFGLFNRAESGIFDFFSAFIALAIKTKGVEFATPSEVIKNFQPISVLSVPQYTSCADEERDLSAWLGNNLQHQAFDTLCSLQRLVRAVNDPQILKDWDRLQSCENLYYMSTKFFNHQSVSSYQTPYEAFINYMNVLSDFAERVNSIPLATQFETYTKEELESAIAKHAQILKELEEVKKKQDEKPAKKEAKSKSSVKTASTKKAVETKKVVAPKKAVAAKKVETPKKAVKKDEKKATVTVSKKVTKTKKK